MLACEFQVLLLVDLHSYNLLIALIPLMSTCYGFTSPLNVLYKRTICLVNTSFINTIFMQNVL